MDGRRRRLSIGEYAARRGELRYAGNRNDGRSRLNKGALLLSVAGAFFVLCVTCGAIVGAASAHMFDQLNMVSSFTPVPASLQRSETNFWLWFTLCVAVVAALAILVTVRAKDIADQGIRRWAVGLAISAPIGGVLALLVAVIASVPPVE